MEEHMSNGEGFKDPTADYAVHNVMKEERKKKRWRNITGDEILKIKREKCVNCFYSSKINVCEKNNNVSNCTCDYMLITGKRRGCRPDECDKYKPAGNKKRRIKPMT